MNNITILNNQIVLGKEFSVYGDIESPLFSAKDVAEMIDNKNVSQMLNAVDEDEKALYIIHRVDGSTHKQWFLTEYGLYEVLMQSRKPIAKEFKKEVKAILKQLRTSGVVITESATQEAINYESKFGKYRIRQTFRETTDLEATWKEFKALSQIERTAKRISGKESINRCNQIIDELSKFKANNLDMPYYKHALYDAMIIEALNEKQRLSNKSNGGFKSNQTKQLNKAEQDNQDLRDELDHWKAYAEELEEYYNPTRIWTTVDYHPFTFNCMYENGHKTHAYNWWIKNFPRNQVPTKKEYEMYQGIDFTKPLGIDLHFVNMEKYDTDNLVKSTLDMIFNRILKVDDNIVRKPVPQTVGF
jgi:prophage antirepressor-like protein